MTDDWSLLKDFVKCHFKDYLPIPTIADLTTYKPLNFLILQNGPSLAARWYEKPPWKLFSSNLPIFESAESIENFAAPRPLEGGSDIPLPEIQEEKLCIRGDDAASKTTFQGQIGKSPAECAEGKVKACNILPSLGELSRYSLRYRDLRPWIEQYCLLKSAEDMWQEAKRGNLFVIHDVIMAGELISKGENKQSLTGRISTFLKLNYKSTNSVHLLRPSEWERFPIAFKIGKIKARRLKHAVHATAVPKSSSSSSSTIIYRLKLEPLRDFCKSSSKRKFGKENSPSSDDSLSPSSSRPAPKRAREGSSRIEPKARKCLGNSLR